MTITTISSTRVKPSSPRFRRGAVAACGGRTPRRLVLHGRAPAFAGGRSKSASNPPAKRIELQDRQQDRQHDQRDHRAHDDDDRRLQQRQARSSVKASNSRSR